ncbi:MAG: hypothetical protein ACPG5T_01665 [Endozoicomonas sp.]
MSASEDLVKINEAIAALRDGKRAKTLKINGKEISFAEMNIDDLLTLKKQTEMEISSTNQRRRIRAKSFSGGKGL